MKNPPITLLRGLFCFSAASVFLLIAGCAPAPPPEPPPPPSRPPIVLVAIDTLRADRLGCYGYHQPTTPRIDRFAEEAVLFEMAVSNSPFSASSYMSLFTGLAPPVHGISNLSSLIKNYPRLTDRIPLLAEILQRQGYLTVGFHGGGNLPAVRGFGRGFEYYGMDFTTTGWEKVSGNIRRWLGTSRESGQPLFLFLHQLICHDPYFNAPKEYQLRFLDDPVPDWPLSMEELRSRYPDISRDLLHSVFWRDVDLKDPVHKVHIDALYDGGVYYSDHLFGELLDLLRDEGIYEDALVILLADHGEALGEHGSRGHWLLWLPHIRVPLLIKFPNQSFGGERVAGPAGLMDVVPTLYDYLEIKVSDPLQGESLLPVIERKAKARERPVVSYRAPHDNPYFHQAAIRIMEGDYSYIRQKFRAEPLLNHYLEYQRAVEAGEYFHYPGEELKSVEDLISRGNYYFGRDLFGEARSCFQLAAEKDPDNARVGLRLAAALREEQRYEEAEALVRSLIDRDPALAEAYRELAWIYCDQRKFGEAAERFFQAAELFPKDYQVYLDWGNCLRRQEGWIEAEDRMLEALRIADGQSAVRLAVARFYLAWGIALNRRSMLELAEEKLEDANRLAGDDPGINHSKARFFLSWGNALQRNGRSAEAEDKMLRALRLSGDNTAVLTSVARYFQRIIKPGRIVGILETRVEESKLDPEWISLLGESYLAEGKVDRARELYRSASRDYTDQVWPDLAWADFLYVIREDAAATDLLEKALESQPGQKWLLRAAGEKFLELGEPRRAAELLAEAVLLEPESGINRLLLGAALRQSGSLSAAEKAIEQADKLLGDDPRLALETGKLYLAQGRARDAGEILARATVDWLGHHALFDLKSDPGETDNIFLELPRVAGRMLELERMIGDEDRILRRYYRGEGEAPGESADMEEEEMEEMQRQLKLLGY